MQHSERLGSVGCSSALCSSVQSEDAVPAILNLFLLLFFQPMMEHVRIHPELVTGSKDHELDPRRYVCRDINVHSALRRVHEWAVLSWVISACLQQNLFCQQQLVCQWCFATHVHSEQVDFLHPSWLNKQKLLWKATNSSLGVLNSFCVWDRICLLPKTWLNHQAST